MPRTINFEGRKINVPDDATDEEVAQIIAPPASMPVVQKPIAAEPMSWMERQLAKINIPTSVNQGLDRARGVAMGAADPTVGLVQLGAHAIGQGDAADAAIKQKESEYQQLRGLRGSEGFDAYRLGGNLISPVNAIPLMRAAQPATALGRVGLGAATGAAFGLAQPVTQGDYVTEKAKQTALGAASGGALPVVTSGLARFIRPNVNPDVQTLMEAGVTPTPGQVMGGAFKSAEEKLTSVPLLGAAIRSGMNRANDQLNRAAANRALAPIGQELPANVGTGQEAVTHVRQTLQNAYDRVLNRIGAVRADPQLNQELQNLSAMTQNLHPDTAAQFQRVIQNEITGRLNPQGFMTSEAMKGAESNIGQAARGYQRSPDYDQQQLGRALEAAQDSLRQWVSRAAPNEAPELAKINEGYANFKRIQKAAGSVAAEDGVFSASQLHGAVKAGDRTKDKRAFSEGTALMQDLSGAAKNVLANRVPNSGTVDRAAGLGAIGAAAVNPLMTAAVLSPALAYTPPVQRGLAALLTQRPQSAQQVADFVRRLGVTGAPLIAQQVSANGGGQ